MVNQMSAGLVPGGCVVDHLPGAFWDHQVQSCFDFDFVNNFSASSLAIIDEIIHSYF